jgi:TonB family protein
MQLRDPEPNSSSSAATGTGPALPLSELESALPSCPIVALTDDPVLLEALAGAALTGSHISSSPSSDRFIDQLVANAAGIALIDASCVGVSLQSFLSTLREQFPQLLILLTGPAQLQAQFEAQIANGTVFRFVHKPASSQRLRLFIDAALRKLVSDTATRRALVAPPPAPAAAGRRKSARPAATAPARRSPAGRWALAALALLGIAWGLWHYASAPDQAPSPSPPPAAAASDATPGPAAPASAASAENSAPAEAAARDAMAREAAAREASAREAARNSAALEEAQRTAQGARAEQVALYVQLARKRLASGALIDPPDDSARGYLESAVAVAPEDAEVRTTSLALGEAMIAQFRHAIAAGELPAAQRWFRACSDYHIGTATLADLSLQLQRLEDTQYGNAAAAPEPVVAATAPSSPPAPVVTPAEIAPAVAPAVVTTPAPAPANEPSWVDESRLTRVMFVPPSYPEEALNHNISGWVDLEFTVGPDGKVAKVTVLQSEPNGLFDRAARTALLRCRYRPVVRDGVAVTQRARMRVRFQP